MAPVFTFVNAVLAAMMAGDAESRAVADAVAAIPSPQLPMAAMMLVLLGDELSAAVGPTGRAVLDAAARLLEERGGPGPAPSAEAAETGRMAAEKLGGEPRALPQAPVPAGQRVSPLAARMGTHAKRTPG